MAGSPYPDGCRVRDVVHQFHHQRDISGGSVFLGILPPNHGACVFSLPFDDLRLAAVRDAVLACGAGAVIKIKAPRGELIERVYNFKYPYEYISRFPELLERKKRIAEFYKSN